MYRWPSVNDLVQNKFCSMIHLLSQHLLAQSYRWKNQMNVRNLLKVNNEERHQENVTDVILVSLLLTPNTFRSLL